MAQKARLGLKIMHGFQFQHPLWLLGLPVLLCLAGWFAWQRGRDSAWSEIVDADLLESLRVPGESRNNSPWVWIGLVWCLSVLALAGPSWEYRRVNAVGRSDSWVAVLDLSPSMAAADTAPDRVTRARYVISDMLAATRGQRVGIVAFAAEAYAVTPLTTDTRTVASLLAPLEPSLMPAPGDNLAPALDEAGRLLNAQSRGSRQVIVLSDGSSDPSQAFAAAQRLQRQGITVNVIGVGTEQGAPEPDKAGGFARDVSGRMVITRLASDQLRRLAAAGGGAYAPLSAAGKLAQAMTALRVEPGTTATRAGSTVSTWQNDGVFLLPPLLLAVAMLARRGWL
jgi:Ca-activated chloride channel family protein